MIYVDSNFLCRLYLQLPGSDVVAELARTAIPNRSPGMVITWLTHLEVTNALERFVFESRSGGQFRISPEAAAAAQGELESDLSSASLFTLQMPSFRELSHTFRNLALRHTARHGFRTYDVLHVAAALVLGCDTFWSFDKKARHLAVLEGLQVN